MARGSRWVLALLLSACAHDLDKLQEDTGSDLRAGSNAPASGSGGSSGSASGAGASGASGASGTSPPDGGADSGAPIEDINDCAPCDPLSEEAQELGFLRCCRGLARSECGLGPPGGAICLPRAAPGEPDTSCPSVGREETEREGCCRPDARCGIDASAVGIGCIARDQLPLALGGARQPLECRLSCERDVDCDDFAGTVTVCTDDPDQPGERYCAAQCNRSADCGPGMVCGLSPDTTLDRSLAVCREAIGPLGPNQTCTSPTECESGVCASVSTREERFCSEFCFAARDCTRPLTRCQSSMIPKPLTRDMFDSLAICLP